MNSANKQLKQDAREVLLPAWSRHTRVSFIVLAAYLAGGYAGGLWSGAQSGEGGMLRFAPVFGLVTALIIELLTGLLESGAGLYFLKLLRGEEASLTDLTVPFREQPDRFLIVGIICIVWEVICFSPAYLAYRFLNTGSAGSYVISALLALLGTISYIYIRLSLSMTCYILLDNNEEGALSAIHRSIVAMKGRKMQLFLLLLSMAGYLLLALCSLMIGLIWVIPYFLTVTAKFYETVRPKVG